MSPAHTSTRQRAVGFAVASLLGATMPLALVASPAEALSASCTDWKEVDEQLGLDPNRARTKCTSIGATTKVRAWLNVNNDSDKHSSYFTTTNVTYSTPWTNCVWGCEADHQLASR